MLFGFSGTIWLVWGVFFLWALVLSVLFYRLFTHYQRLTKGIVKKDLRSVLEKLLKEIKSEKERLSVLTEEVKRLEKNSLFHLQRVGLVRFNPFAETGGNQSFCLAFLDAYDSGLVISSLHSRETTRIYAKPIKKGKEAGYAFSEEEKRAIQQAKKIRKNI